MSVVDPCLPEWLDRLALANVHVGAARVDLRFERTAGGRIEFEAEVREGELQICSG